MHQRIILFCSLFLFLLTTNSLRAGGGPDAYGYTWLNNTDLGGPSVNFINIQSTGTPITGLGDDNSVGPINMGFTFHYYWGDYNQVKVGSNGWLALDNVSNIASCFPTLPTPGGAGDNYVAPLLSDLIFTGGGNPAAAYSWSNNVDTFIIAFHDVPFWQAATPGYYGSNTFEVIFSGVDSSITIQYATMNTTSNTGCATNIVGGIESPSGQYGLQHFVNTVPASNSAVRFIYPDSVLISVLDAKVSWNLAADNGARFFAQGPVNLITNIANAGNTNLTTPTSVQGRILDMATTQLFTNTQSLATLNVGTNNTVNFSPGPNLPLAGQYYFETTIGNTQDVNAANDVLNTEIEIVDLTGPSVTLSYVENAANEGGLGWSGGDDQDGVGIYMEPPVYPITISSTEFYISAISATPSFAAVIYDDDGPGGSPGTVLDSTVVVTTTSGAWYTATPSSTVTITSGGFYIGWKMTGGAGMNIGTRTSEPISRRTYEVLGGNWGGYRSATTTDFMIRANVTGYPCIYTGSYTSSATGLTAQFTNTSVGSTSTLWDFGDGNTSTAANPQHTYATSGDYYVCLIASNSCGSDTICDTVQICQPTVAAFSDSSAGLTHFLSDNSVDATSWQWDFGNGMTSNLQNPSVTYSQPGYYTICLITSNSCSSDTSCMDSVLVCIPPTSGFSSTATSTGAASFTDLSTGFGIATWAWDFGDGGTATTQNPTHTYTASGTYTVCLVVTDICGSDTTCNTVNITIVGIPDPLADPVTVYPNPSGGLFHLRGLPQVPVQIRILDVRGKMVRDAFLSPSTGEATLDLSGVPSGIYLLEVDADGLRSFLKLLVE